MKSRAWFRIVPAVALLFAGVAFAAGNDATLSSGDRKFLRQAAQAGIAEVEAAKLAGQKAEDQAVKDFARRMQEDHAKAGDELDKLAQAKGVNLPHDVDRRHHRRMDELRAHTAAQFERDYMRAQVSDHRKVVRAFEHEAKGGHDADVKKFAQEKLPVLREHLRMAQAAFKGVKDTKSRPAAQPGQDTSGSTQK